MILRQVAEKSDRLADSVWKADVKRSVGIWESRAGKIALLFYKNKKKQSLIM